MNRDAHSPGGGIRSPHYSSFGVNAHTFELVHELRELVSKRLGTRVSLTYIIADIAEKAIQRERQLAVTLTTPKEHSTPMPCVLTTNDEADRVLREGDE